MNPNQTISNDALEYEHEIQRKFSREIWRYCDQFDRVEKSHIDEALNVVLNSKFIASSRYKITQKQPMMVLGHYIIEAQNEKEAIDNFNDGDYEYIGHTLSDNIEFVDNEVVSIEKIS